MGDWWEHHLCHVWSCRHFSYFESSRSTKDQLGVSYDLEYWMPLFQWVFFPPPKKCTISVRLTFFKVLHAVQPGRHFGSLPCWNGIPGIGAWMPPALRWLLPWWFPSWAFWQDLAWWPLASQLKSGAVDRSVWKGQARWFFQIVKIMMFAQVL